MTLTVLDTFAGIGGFSLGLEATGFFETVAFCELEDYPRRVLAKNWPDVYCHGDIRTLRYTRDGSEEPDDWILYDEELDHEIVRGPINLVSGGFPCQDTSLAGNQAGIAGEKSGLFEELARLIGEIRPQYALLENVPGLLSGDRGRWFGRVLGALAALGYRVEWHSLSASDTVRARHRRDRVWIIADRDGFRSQGPGRGKLQQTQGARQLREELADTVGERLERILEARTTAGTTDGSGDGRDRGRWTTEPDLGRVAHGIPARVDRLKCLGNAIVPQMAELLGYAIADHAGLS